MTRQPIFITATSLLSVWCVRVLRADVKLRSRAVCFLITLFIFFPPQLPSHPLTPSRHAEGRAMTVAPTYHTLPHPSSHGTSLSSTMMWGPLEPPNTPKPWSLSCLRPAPPLRPSAALCYKEVRTHVIMQPELIQMFFTFLKLFCN